MCAHTRTHAHARSHARMLTEVRMFELHFSEFLEMKLNRGMAALAVHSPGYSSDFSLILLTKLSLTSSLDSEDEDTSCADCRDTEAQERQKTKGILLSTKLSPNNKQKNPTAPSAWPVCAGLPCVRSSGALCLHAEQQGGGRCVSLLHFFSTILGFPFTSDLVPVFG